MSSGFLYQFARWPVGAEPWMMKTFTEDELATHCLLAAQRAVKSDTVDGHLTWLEDHENCLYADVYEAVCVHLDVEDDPFEKHDEEKWLPFLQERIGENLAEHCLALQDANDCGYFEGRLFTGEMSWGDCSDTLRALMLVDHFEVFGPGSSDIVPGKDPGYYRVINAEDGVWLEAGHSGLPTNIAVRVEFNADGVTTAIWRDEAEQPDADVWTPWEKPA